MFLCTERRNKIANTALQVMKIPKNVIHVFSVLDL